MVKQLKILLLCTGTLLGTSSFATNYELSKGLSKEYELPPKQVQTFSNYLPWTVNASCKVRTESNSKSTIHFTALSYKFVINGHILTAGDTFDLVVSPSDKIEIEADAHAQASLQNDSEQFVNLLCQTK